MSNENTSHTPLFTKKSVPHYDALSFPSLWHALLQSSFRTVAKMPCGKNGKQDGDTEWRIYYLTFPSWFLIKKKGNGLPSPLFSSVPPIAVRTSASFPVVTASLRNTADSPLTVFSDGTELYVFILRRIISAIIRGKTANYPACNQCRGKYCFLPHKNTFFQNWSLFIYLYISIITYPV